MTILMTDEDVARFIVPDPGAIVRLIREAARAAEQGSLLSGPRRVLVLWPETFARVLSRRDG